MRSEGVAPRAAIEARSLDVRFGRRPALIGVNLSARSGELVSLVGPNGSGKTTFIRTALGLLSPSSGSVELLGDPVDRLSIRERALRASWVPQDESPYDNVAVFDYVLYGRYAHGRSLEGETEHDRAQARAALESVGLWDRRFDGIHEVSGGERQRVLLARALSQETPIVLLDEPTAHLDVGHQLDLLERVRALCRSEGKCALAAIHDLNLAARYSDRLVVLSRGRVVADGPPREVLSETLLYEVWGVLAEIRDDPRSGLPYLVPRLPNPSKGRPSGRAAPGIGPVHVVGGGGSAAGILRALVAEGFRVTAGALPLLDTDTEVARELDVPFVAEAPFAPLSSEVRARNRGLLEEAAAIVVAPFAVGPSNLANLEDLLPIVGRTPVYLISGGPRSERDFTGGTATELLRKLEVRGAVEVTGTAALVEVLRRAPAPAPAVGDGPARPGEGLDRQGQGTLPVELGEKSG